MNPPQQPRWISAASELRNWTRASQPALTPTAATILGLLSAPLLASGSRRSASPAAPSSPLAGTYSRLIRPIAERYMRLPVAPPTPKVHEPPGIAAALSSLSANNPAALPGLALSAFDSAAGVAAELGDSLPGTSPSARTWPAAGASSARDSALGPSNAFPGGGSDAASAVSQPGFNRATLDSVRALNIEMKFDVEALVNRLRKTTLEQAENAIAARNFFMQRQRLASMR